MLSESLYAEIFSLSWFYVLIALLAVINLGLTAWYSVRLISEREHDRITALEFGINAILFFSLLIAFFAFLGTFRGMMPGGPTPAASGTGDPRVIIGGILSAMIPLNMSLTVAVFFLLAWFILRAILQKKLG